MVFRAERPADRLVLALDVPSIEEADAVLAEVGASVGVVKIGLQLLYAGGIELARRLVQDGRRVFLDAKLLDIDNTVAHAVESIVGLKAAYLTIHAYPKAMRAAAAARGSAATKLLAVTVLTSLDDADLAAAGYARTAADLVRARAEDARAAGMDGVVCSPAEVGGLRKILGPDMLLVTPGIRPAGADLGDQRRVATPAQAIRDGADLIVVGRPILAARDRRAAAEGILAEISDG